MSINCIIDCHAHIYPDTSGASGFDSVEQHMMMVLLRGVFNNHSAVQRVTDGSIDKEVWKKLWDVKLPGLEGYRDVEFKRIERGKLVFMIEGIEYFVNFHWSYMPPEQMIQLMDANRVDKAVLSCGSGYGRLEKYYAEANRRYPGRFIGLTWIEPMLFRPEEMIDLLDKNIHVLGMRGLFVGPLSPGNDAYYNLHTTKYVPFWEKVEQLHIPVFWCFPNRDFETQFQRFARWVQQYPDVPSILVHGFARNFICKDEKVALPGDAVNLIKNHNVFIEVVPGLGSYPWLGAECIVRYLYDTFGPQKLLWGSDAPEISSVQYGKIVRYLSENCDFLDKNAIDLIMGGNIKRIFN